MLIGLGVQDDKRFVNRDPGEGGLGVVNRFGIYLFRAILKAGLGVRAVGER